MSKQRTQETFKTPGGARPPAINPTWIDPSTLEDEDSDDVGHTDADLIAAYRDGTLPAEEAERFREHLLECSDCAELLLLMPSHDRSETAVADFDKKRTWKRLRDEIRLHELEGTRREEIDPHPSRTSGPQSRSDGRAWWRSTGQLAAVAAALLLVIPLGILSHQQSQTIAELTSPRVNAALYPVAVVFRNADGTGSQVATDSIDAQIPANVEHFTLAFLIDNQTNMTTGRVEILDSMDRLVWSGEGLAIKGYQASLGLSRRFLSAGEYTIRIFEQTEGAAAIPLAEVAVRITYLDEGD